MKERGTEGVRVGECGVIEACKQCMLVVQNGNVWFTIMKNMLHFYSNEGVWDGFSR